MTLHHDDDRPGRPDLRAVPVEPPFDPDYDTPSDARRTPQDPAAERALLAALLTQPTLATQLEHHLDEHDFYRPPHATIWATLHHLRHTHDADIDAVTLNAALINGRHTEAARALTDILDTDTNPALADQYAKVIRDTARARAFADAGRELTRLATSAPIEKVDAYLADAHTHLDTVATRFGPTIAHTNTGLADLTWIITGPAPTSPPPTWARRTDGTALFYNGRVNGVFGDPESGKTWLAQIAGVEALNTGGTFTMVDVDHNGQDHTAGRLLLLGAHPEHLADPDRFRYYEPEDADQLRAAITDIVNRTPDVVVLDSLGELLPMLGVKSVDNDEITAALREIVMPPAKAGSCVIAVDHLPKSAEARTTGYAIGGTAKKRAVDGAYLRAEARQQPTPGGIGRITLRIEKDRTGELRKSSGGGYAGTFTLNSTEPHVTTWTIGRDELPKNDDGTFRPTGYMEKVATYVADNDSCTQNDIETGIPGTAKHIRAALQILVTEGHITRMPGPRRSWLHTLTIPYREAEDDHAQPTL